MSSRRQHFKRIHSKKLPFLSQVSRMGVSKKRESTDKSKLFSAPKTLSQIKEEKRRAKGDWNLGPQLSGTNVEDEFQGPKSLAEILQSKRSIGVNFLDAGKRSFLGVRFDVLTILADFHTVGFED
nr:zinc finger CCCH domain-containing protein 34-like [Ipomoea batatas]